MNALVLLATAYFNFMTMLGASPETPNFNDELPKFFSAHVKKIENGVMIVEGLEALAQQLTTAHRHAFPWTTELISIDVDEGKKTATVVFSWVSEKLGKHITSAKLTFDDNTKIVEIFEVYNKFAEPTAQPWQGFAPKADAN